MPAVCSDFVYHSPEHKETLTGMLHFYYSISTYLKLQFITSLLLLVNSLNSIIPFFVLNVYTYIFNLIGMHAGFIQ
jgi:hypothetical protein